jgi:aminomethyltransferase
MSPNAPYIALTAATAAWTTSDLGQFEVSGPDAGAFVNRVTTADLSALPPGRFVHALLLRDDATILARVTVYRFDDMVMLLVDGAARAEAWKHLVERKRGTVRLRDISTDVAVIAVRGPRTVAQLTTELVPMPQQSGDISRARFGGIGVFAARTTADGPDGFDLYCRGRDLPTLGDTLARHGVAMVDDDTWNLVRLELGVARLGIEIEAADTPVEAGLESLVAQHKGAPFPGEAAYAERLRTGPIRRLVGFSIAGSDAPPVGTAVHAAGRAVDRVRAVGTSPRFGVIGMTAVPLGADAPGTPLVIGSNGQEWQAVVAKTPFGSGNTT